MTHELQTLELAHLSHKLAHLSFELANLYADDAHLCPQLRTGLADRSPELAHLNPDLSHLNPNNGPFELLIHHCLFHTFSRIKKVAQRYQMVSGSLALLCFYF